MKLNVKAPALTCGLVFEFGLFLLIWWMIAFDGATGEVTVIGRAYRGCTISPRGIIGFSWAFLDWLSYGAIFAGLYDVVASGIAK